LDFSHSEVCDLFAGTGSLGIEALSRGARRAVFIESDPQAIDIIHCNLKKTKLGANALVRHQDVNRFLDQTPEKPFDLVLADPPYRLKLGNFIVEKLITNGYLSLSAVIVLETAPDEILAIERFEKYIDLHKQKKYGETLVTILKYNVY
jgi:16S rRNA (guanine966-N2)-methyltransferase